MLYSMFTHSQLSRPRPIKIFFSGTQSRDPKVWTHLGQSNMVISANGKPGGGGGEGGATVPWVGGGEVWREWQDPAPVRPRRSPPLSPEDPRTGLGCSALGAADANASWVPQTNLRTGRNNPVLRIRIGFRIQHFRSMRIRMWTGSASGSRV